MRTLINFLLITVFLLSGVSQVPACYATKPNCQQKNTSSCPLSGEKLTEAETSKPACPLMAENMQQQAEANFPPERYKRLKIEQIQFIPIEIPPFIPSFIVPMVLEKERVTPASYLVAGTFTDLHFHPPPLFIQLQSFLI